MVVVAVKLSRLLRRGLFVVALAAAGWLLGVAFAGSAGADELAGDNAQTQSSGLLGGLLNGLTGITTSLVDTSGDILAPVLTPESTPVIELPSILPDTGSSSGSVATDRNDVGRSDTVVPAPVVTPPAPVVPVAPVAPEPPAPPAAPPVVHTPVVPAAPAAQDFGSAAGEQAGGGGSEPQPGKAPSAPAGSGATMSSAHDNSGGARGTQGVLTSQTTLHPADAGFTTRSRAVNAAGRTAGLPASSPD